jgi:hypothetical protein
MAFEKTGKGMEALLAAKQATASPLAEHLNFKGAFKQARLLQMNKAIEGERDRGLKRSEGELNRASAEKIAGVGTTGVPDFNSGLRQAEAGQISYADLRRRFPEKANQIKQARIGRLSPQGQDIMSQIDTLLEKDKSGKGRMETLRAVLKDLLSEDASASGVEVEDILSILGIPREKAEEVIKSRGWFDWGY